MKYNRCVLILTILILAFSYMCGHDGVSHSCHVFGAISGLLTGYFLLKNRDKNEIEELCIKAAIVLFVCWSLDCWP
jgi:membrane associated rhomboid family serine protease